MREVKKNRKTSETEVKVELNIDGSGNREINTPIKFFTHMLEQFAAHGGFDLKIDVQSHDKDNHHVIEDVALTLGDAFKEALGDKKGIVRYGNFILPMDEALSLAVIDLSGRAFSKISAEIKDEKTSDFETVLLPHFFNSFAQASLSTIHIKMLEGSDTHHIIEAVFKSFARALSIACSIDESKKDLIPSTKGIL
ncbi:MAG: imidazoleglycerol-phosphate dehydratase HisB [Candidatus Gastranaerophilales bacterium]|nr:imidazoleglycerol-phosphate dehydratase HisB [Candidatus Gastranaerophilales bacterium]